VGKTHSFVLKGAFFSKKARKESLVSSNDLIQECAFLSARTAGTYRFCAGYCMLRRNRSSWQPIWRNIFEHSTKGGTTAQAARRGAWL
jgi:hypothetical protein